MLTKIKELAVDVKYWFRRNDLWYWIRCHTYNRYHIVDCRNDYYDETPYRWGWIDRDHLMLIACFNILVDFVENEHPFEVINWGEDPNACDKDVAPEYWDSMRHAASEIKSLYEWWKNGRRKEHQNVTRLFNLHFSDQDSKAKRNAWLKAHDDCEARDNENLERLMKIRRYMWT